MKIPVKPPDYQEVIQKSGKNYTQYLENIGPTDTKGRYLHWDRLRHLTPPEGFTSEQWWAGMKLNRIFNFKDLDFKCKNDSKCVFYLTDEIQEQLHWLDKNAAGTITSSMPVTNTSMRKAYMIKSLIREAISSSQMEGATTTRKVAKDMIRQGRTPKDKSEQMIFNNYHAMQFIIEFKNEELTPGIILELHKILTEKTLDNENKAGVFRIEEDKDIHVVDETTVKILHTPPDAKGLEARMQKVCDFANNGQSGNFIHPVLKAIILHFMLAYEHPFVDGNGRTARALFYWAMINEGYWLAEFISISQVIKRAPVKYGKAFLYTETDDNDLTYFILYQLEIIKKAISELHEYLSEKMEGIKSAQDLLYGAKKLRNKLNIRQVSLLKHALSHPNFIYSINEYQNSYGIAYETARKDLMQMSDVFSFLKKLKDGRTFVFISPSDLKERIESQKE
ncbi:MAG: Fic family protein [Deltaproteobacteria bacterium]|nr:Fic family protein [Deltaproteobacteria bacterium]